MKKQLLSLFFVLTLLGSCNDSDDFTPEINVATVHTVNNREQVLKIPVTSNTDWVLIKESYRWCVPDKMRGGAGNDTLILHIAENIDYKERKFSIGIGNPSASRMIQITQQAATEEYHYKLPVIFHILYDDPSTPQQNVAADVIAKAIEEINAYYRNSVNSVDMNVEFVLATHDPDGNLLKEPGIERIYSDSPTEMEYEDFMLNFDNILYVWDLNRYINVFTFPFIEERVLGVSSVPFTIGYDPLDGLGIGDKFIYDPELIDYPQCIALNNHYILTEHSILKVSDLLLTLTHELGHYLGLFHTFEDDYCDDTEAYDRYEYESWLKSLSVKLPFEELASRTTSDGKKFVSYNIMDYDYAYLNQFTLDQRKRVRHVLENSPLIPGPKHTDYMTRSTHSMEIPKQRFVH